MPYGAETNPNIAKTEQGENPFKKSFAVLFNCSKHPGFWILSSTFFICGFTSNGLVSQHFIPFCADNNVGIIVASSYLATIGLFNFIGSIGSGWLADKFDNYKLLATFYGVRGLSLVYLPFSSLDVFYLTLWAIFFGLDFIATIPPKGRFCSKFLATLMALLRSLGYFLFIKFALLALLMAREGQEIFFLRTNRFFSWLE